jgi:trans-2,3-dihydro-3-hydroxyanthranilate isomerase
MARRLSRLHTNEPTIASVWLVFRRCRNDCGNVINRIASYPGQSAMGVVSCGVPFLFVPLKSLQDVRSIQFRRDVWERVLRNFEAPHVFVFTQETEIEGSTVHCRMFAPALGISEDPATGGASGPLGCYLVHHKVISLDENGEVECVSEQGFEIGRPSFIKINIKQNRGVISEVRVGGQCYFMGEGYLLVN